MHVVVETPRGARAKLTFDPELKTFVLSKALMLGLSYPYDWGFIPSTRAEDGDPLDAMVIHDAATTPGLVLRCKIIGVLQTIQKTKRNRIRNDRVIAVPKDSHRERELQGVEGLPSEVKEELENVPGTVRRLRHWLRIAEAHHARRGTSMFDVARFRQWTGRKGWRSQRANCHK